MDTEAIFKALADPTRLRILRLLGAMELAVGELAQVLGQSQPRVSRHVAILADTGLAQRRREGSWVFLRASPAGQSRLVDRLSAALEEAEREDGNFALQCAQDRRKLAEIREARDRQAENFFARHATEWDELRRLHSPDRKVEQALVEALETCLDNETAQAPGAEPLGRLLDIGTGTGRMAELFAPMASHIVALDKSLEMLRIARARLQRLPAERIEIVQGDFSDLPFADASFDTVLFHQVLHFAQAPEQAIIEAARVTREGGRIAIVDFAAHGREELRERYAHARLGFDDEQIDAMFERAGYAPAASRALKGKDLVIKIWTARRLAAGKARSPHEQEGKAA